MNILQISQKVFLVSQNLDKILNVQKKVNIFKCQMLVLQQGEKLLQNQAFYFFY